MAISPAAFPVCGDMTTRLLLCQAPTMARTPKQPLSDFGTRLRQAIEDSDAVKDRADLLRKLGTDGATLYRYEKGERSPPLDLVQRIAAILGIDVADIARPSEPADATIDTPGWLDFVRRGYVQLFVSRGATPAMIESVRRDTRFKGGGTWKDYVEAMEAQLESVERTTPEPLRQARQRNAAAGRAGGGRSFVKPPAKK